MVVNESTIDYLENILEKTEVQKDALLFLKDVAASVRGVKTQVL